ncbi:hypothetical protein [Rhodovulum sp. MB263]|uniref:hypothetical protein n=1 Tax=Rhodovulum sp. (strain MB263) TaxID=308754 RepID=UPI0026D00D6D
MLLDFNLPDVSRLDGLIRLKTTLGATPVVVLSSIAGPRLIGTAIRAGAVGRVPKRSTRDVFRYTIVSIAEGIEIADDPEQTAAKGREHAIRS